jgi:hypothetical protein
VYGNGAWNALRGASKNLVPLNCRSAAGSAAGSAQELEDSESEAVAATWRIKQQQAAAEAEAAAAQRAEAAAAQEEEEEDVEEFCPCVPPIVSLVSLLTRSCCCGVLMRAPQWAILARRVRGVASF